MMICYPSLCVFAHKDGSFFERTYNFSGGEHKNA